MSDVLTLVTSPFGVFLIGVLTGAVLGDWLEPFEFAGRQLSRVSSLMGQAASKIKSFFG